MIERGEVSVEVVELHATLGIAMRDPRVEKLAEYGTGQRYHSGETSCCDPCEVA